MAHDIFSGQDVAVKLEPMQGVHCTLKHEFLVYKKLCRRMRDSICALLSHRMQLQCDGYGLPWSNPRAAIHLLSLPVQYQDCSATGEPVGESIGFLVL